MIRLSTITAVMIFIAGCASNGTEAPVRDAGGVAQASTATTADADGVAASKETELVDSAEVEQVAAASEKRDEMICKRVRLTGSNRMEKICRPRSEVDETMRETHRALREMEMRSSKRGGAN